jgi:hypothetical protein
VLINYILSQKDCLVSLTEEHKLQVSEGRVLRKIVTPEKDKVTAIYDIMQ